MDRRGGKSGWCWAAGAAMAAAALALLLAARRVPGFGSWYAVTVYPWLVDVFGRIWGIFPWSMSEWGLYALMAAFLAYGVRHIRRPGMALSRLWVGTSALFLLYALNCGVNYYRTPFSRYLDLEVTGYSGEELEALCVYLTLEANRAARDIEAEREPGLVQGVGAEREPGLVQGVGAEREPGTGLMGNSVEERGSYQKSCVAAMEALGEEYPQLSGFYPRPKPVTASRILSVQQLCGVYSPFTIEANYNREMPGYGIPHTICHELSHLRGFMREDEANFIGYLACIRSGDPSLRYSGYLTGWYYAMAAYSHVDPERFSQLWGELDPAAMRDIREDIAFWSQFEGKVAEASANVNNSYLKINNQDEGIHTYGRIVDLMLAYFYAG